MVLVLVVIVIIIDDVCDWVLSVVDKLKIVGVYCELDLCNEKIGYKVCEYSKVKVLQIWVVGKNEVEVYQVVVCQLGSKNNDVLDLDDVLQKLIDVILLSV